MSSTTQPPKTVNTVDFLKLLTTTNIRTKFMSSITQRPKTNTVDCVKLSTKANTRTKIITSTVHPPKSLTAVDFFKLSTSSSIDDVYKSAGNAKSSLLLFPHYIAIYSLLILVFSIIVIVIISVYRFNVSIKQKALNFRTSHIYPRTQLHRLESSAYYTEKRNSLQTTETSTL
jgi:hypothetical protein